MIYHALFDGKQVCGAVLTSKRGFARIEEPPVGDPLHRKCKICDHNVNLDEIRADRAKHKYAERVIKNLDCLLTIAPNNREEFLDNLMETVAWLDATAARNQQDIRAALSADAERFAGADPTLARLILLAGEL